MIRQVDIFKNLVPLVMKIYYIKNTKNCLKFNGYISISFEICRSFLSILSPHGFNATGRAQDQAHQHFIMDV